MGNFGFITGSFEKFGRYCLISFHFYSAIKSKTLWVTCQFKFMSIIVFLISLKILSNGFATRNCLGSQCLRCQKYLKLL